MSDVSESNAPLKKALTVLSLEQQEGQIERVQRAKVGVVFRLPYLASSMLSIPVAAVSLGEVATFATDGERILFNPSFVATLSDMEIRGVLLHELMHVLLEHQERRQTRDSRLWNVACDFAVNLILNDMKVTLPEGVLYNPDFRGMTAEKIYDQLLDESRSDPNGTRSNREKVGSRGENSHSTSSNNSSNNDVRVERDGVGVLPQELGDDLQAFPAEVVAREDLQTGVSKEMFKATLKKWREELAPQIRGTQGGGWEQEIHLLQRYGVNWTYLLQNWLTEKVRDEWSLWPPSKKHIWRGIYLPSFGGVSVGTVAIAIDTSGSMSNAVLGRVLSEVKVFRETFHCTVVVIEVDAEIQRIRTIDPYDSFLEEKNIALKGRGGTDTRPVFNWLKTSDAANVCGLIYVTDGYAAFPKEAPDLPVIWLLTEDIDERYLPKWGLKAYVN